MRATSFLIGMVLWVNLCYAQDSDLYPDFITIQYAGSIGYKSLGVGYEIKDRARVSAHYGFVPASRGGILHIVTGKYLFTPITIEQSSKLNIQPLNVGAMITYHFGENFYTRWPSDRYPKGYYWWPSALRLHLVLESAVTYQLTDSFFKSVSGYIEFNTNDLYVVSYVLNVRSINFFDIIKSGVGVRLRF
jgi:hypothetical protein